MDEERRETVFRDKYGDFKEWTKVTGIILLCMGLLLFIIGIFTGLDIIQSKYEAQAFNRVHETDYTWAEWFWAEGTIKEYHLGTVENKNYQIDLNIKNLPIELEGGRE